MEFSLTELNAVLGHIKNLGKWKKDFLNFKKNNSVLLAVCLNNKKHIGNLKIGPINQYHNTADISYFIGDKKEWGKGYATDALKLAVKYSFNNLKLYKCIAGVYKSNVASSKVLMRSEFKKEATLKKIFKSGSKREDHLIYSIKNKKFYV